MAEAQDLAKSVAFSLGEIKEAKIVLKDLKKKGYKVDVRRKSIKSANVDLLKQLGLETVAPSKPSTKKGAAKKSTTKKTTSVKTSKSTKSSATTEKDEENKKGETSKEETKLAIKDLSELDGITKRQIEKLKDVGVDVPAKLLEEDIRALSKMIKITQKQLKAWIAQIKGE